MAAFATPTTFRSPTRILIASPNPDFRQRLKTNPRFACSESEEAVGGAHALAKLLHFPCDSVLLDRNLPDLDASEVADQIRKQFPQTEVELFDGHGPHLSSQQSTSVASWDHALQPEALEHEDVLENKPELQYLPPARTPGALNTLPGVVGSSRVMQQVNGLVRMVAQRDTTVLITGETGTGKELVANAVHQLSRRSRQPFVVVNCAAIPEALMESELFGYTRGAFTGAVQSRLGRIHVAQGGTLFLDEIGELPLSMQAKLLRFLQNGEVQRLGSSDVYRVDVRVVCATNMELPQLVNAKQFRQDLYYRLAVFPIVVPPLRERAEDIPELSKHFLSTLARDSELPLKHLTARAVRHLQEGSWAGNIRELQHALERAFILSGADTEIDLAHFAATAVS